MYQIIKFICVFNVKLTISIIVVSCCQQFTHTHINKWIEKIFFILLKKSLDLPKKIPNVWTFTTRVY